MRKLSATRVEIRFIHDIIIRIHAHFFFYKTMLCSAHDIMLNFVIISKQILTFTFQIRIFFPTIETMFLCMPSFSLTILFFVVLKPLSGTYIHIHTQGNHNNVYQRSHIHTLLFTQLYTNKHTHINAWNNTVRYMENFNTVFQHYKLTNIENNL